MCLGIVDHREVEASRAVVAGEEGAAEPKEGAIGVDIEGGDGGPALLAAAKGAVGGPEGLRGGAALQAATGNGARCRPVDTERDKITVIVI